MAEQFRVDRLEVYRHGDTYFVVTANGASGGPAVATSLALSETVVRALAALLPAPVVSDA